jgi:hypothetical protein
MKTLEIRDKIMQGTKLAIKKLVAKKREENSFLIVSEQGKVIKLQASDIHI